MRFNKSVYRDLGLKIFSLFLATVVWVYINGMVQKIGGGPPAYKDFKDVEIKLMGEPLFLGKNLVVVELDQKSVDLRLKGPGREIEKLTEMDITAYIDISGLKPGKAYSPVVNFILPPNIKMVGASSLVRVEIKDKNL